MKVAAAAMASAHMDPEACQRTRYPLENPATCAEGIPDADATSGRRGNAHRRPADDHDTAASVTTQPTTRTTIIADDHAPQVPWAVSSSPDPCCWARITPRSAASHHSSRGLVSLSALLGRLP